MQTTVYVLMEIRFFLGIQNYSSQTNSYILTYKHGMDDILAMFFCQNLIEILMTALVWWSNSCISSCNNMSYTVLQI